MAIQINRLIAAGCAAFGLLVTSSFVVGTADAARVRREPNGAVRFYDDRGYDRGYSWCRIGGGSSFGAPVCNYYTREQCRASGSPNGDCVPNPWSYYVKVPPQRLQLQ